MATNTERLDELERIVRGLMGQEKVAERNQEVTAGQLADLARGREDFRRICDELRAADEAVRNRVTVLEHEVAELKKAREEWTRRAWALLVPVVTAFLGAILGYLLKR